jgi:hypothetical protein
LGPLTAGTIVGRDVILYYVLPFTIEYPHLIAAYIDIMGDVLELIVITSIAVVGGIIDIADFIPGVNFKSPHIPSFKPVSISATQVKQYATVLLATCPSYNSPVDIARIGLRYSIGDQTCAFNRYLYPLATPYAATTWMIGETYHGDATPIIGVTPDSNCAQASVQQNVSVMLTCSVIGVRYFLVYIVIPIIFIVLLMQSCIKGILKIMWSGIDIAYVFADMVFSITATVVAELD